MGKTLTVFKVYRESEKAIQALFENRAYPKHVWIPKSIMEEYKEENIDSNSGKASAYIPDWFLKRHGL